LKQQQFEDLYRPAWDALDAMLAAERIEPESDFPRQYRALCHHLAVAKSRRYSRSLIDYLNERVLACHRLLYRDGSAGSRGGLRYLLRGFPQALRRNQNYVAVSAALFLLPLFFMAVACYLNSELIYSLMDPANVRHFEYIYSSDAEVLGRERGSDTDIAMFGFYINNNIGIGFRTFASGIFFGIGSVFFLIFNGLSIGGVAGHLTQIGATDTFFTFVVGHGALELSAIVFCGAAGLKLGFSLLDPGPLRRMEALKQAARDAVVIVYGAAVLLFLAAFVEAFWSSMTAPPEIKYSVGAGIALALALYLTLAGRSRAT